MEHSDIKHPKLIINPQKLNPGSIAVLAEVQDTGLIEVMSHKATINGIGHNDGANTDLVPMELLLSSLGLCITKTLKLVIEQRKMDIPRFIVALSQKREDNKTIIKCEIIVEAHLNEAGRAFLKDAMVFCPTAQLLNAEIRSEIIIS